MPADMPTNDAGQPAIVTERREATWVVTINRPEVRNALDGATAAALAQAFRTFENDTSLAVAILAGSDGTFSSGFDLKASAEDPGVLRVSEEGDGPLGVTRMLLCKPVIAAVEGYAVGGGFELALWCDLRVAADNAIFGVFNRRWGVPLVDGGTIRLPRLIGHSHALDLILTGRGISGHEALTMGVANRLTRPGEALAMALDLANDLTRLPQQCLRSDRLGVYEQWDLSWEDALVNETRRGLDVMRSGEAAEGARRFAGGHGRHGSTSDI